MISALQTLTKEKMVISYESRYYYSRMEPCASLACIELSIVSSSDPSNHRCLSHVLGDRDFQVSDEMIDRAEVRPPAGPLRDTYRVLLTHS